MWIKNVALALCVIALVSGCMDGLAVGREKVRYVLKDGETAQFRGEQHFKRGDKDVYCGEVNAKNSYGAYGGFSRYVVLGSVVVLHGEEPADLPASESKSKLVSEIDVLNERLTIQWVMLRLKNELLRERVALLEAGGYVPPQPTESDYYRAALQRLVGALTDEYCKAGPGI